MNRRNVVINYQRCLFSLISATLLWLVPQAAWATSIATSDPAAAAAFVAGAQGPIGFDEVPGNNQAAGSAVDSQNAIDDEFKSIGLLFSSTGGPAVAVNFPGDAFSDPNLLAGTSNPSGTVVVDYAQPINVQFVIPGTNTPTTGNLIGVWLDPTGSSVKLEVFDAGDNSIESVQGNQGEFIAIKASGIARATFSFVQAQAFPGFSIDDLFFGLSDHFLCYKAKTTAGTEKFLPVPGVTLTDQFDTETVEVKKPVSLCNPADKNEEGINDPDTHLLGYKIKQEALHEPVTGIIVKNQFHPDGLSVDTIKPERLLVPTLKDLVNPVTLPDPFEPNVDHFKCYKVKVTPGTAKLPKGIQATVVDQFNQPKLYDIKKPTRLCTPVLDKEHPPGTHTLAKNPDVHLMCYKVKPATKHIPVTGIHVNNQFGPEQLDTIKEEELCVPSVKIIE